MAGRFLQAALVGILALAVACQAAPRYSDVELDLWRMGLGPIHGAIAPARLTPEQAIARIQMDFPNFQIEPVRVGRRWAIHHNTTAWVVVFRFPEPGEWSARVLDDQTGNVLFVFDEGSLRASRLPVPDW
jgi:hypothetical protein